MKEQALEKLRQAQKDIIDAMANQASCIVTNDLDGLTDATSEIVKLSHRMETQIMILHTAKSITEN